MNGQSEVETLLVEDNPYDAELALRALKKSNLANHLAVVTDGEEARGSDINHSKGRHFCPVSSTG